MKGHSLPTQQPETFNRLKAGNPDLKNAAPYYSPKSDSRPEDERSLPSDRRLHDAREYVERPIMHQALPGGAPIGGNNSNTNLKMNQGAPVRQSYSSSIPSHPSTMAPHKPTAPAYEGHGTPLTRSQPTNSIDDVVQRSGARSQALRTSPVSENLPGPNSESQSSIRDSTSSATAGRATTTHVESSGNRFDKVPQFQAGKTRDELLPNFQDMNELSNSKNSILTTFKQETNAPTSALRSDDSVATRGKRIYPTSTPAVPGVASSATDSFHATYLEQRKQPSVPPSPMKPKIDPNQIPSPVGVQAMDEQRYAHQDYITTSREMPPLASTSFTAIDSGNCNPRYMRSTLYSIPASEELLRTSKLPFGIILEPFANIKDTEHPVEQVDFKEQGPIRCHRCRGYINPFVTFVEDGMKFICNLCSFKNDVPSEYFCGLDFNGRRSDLAHRPELRYGTIEFVAPADYGVADPKPAALVFALNVSSFAASSGLLGLYTAAIKKVISILSTNPKFDLLKFGLITFNDSVHFYNFDPTLAQAQMMVVSDINEMFAPLSKGFLVSVKESKRLILDLMDRLPNLFSGVTFVGSCLVAALQGVRLAMESHGGRVLVFECCMPNIGPGLLKPIEDTKLSGTDKDNPMMTPRSPIYAKLASQYSGSGIGIDLFLLATSFVDVATLGVLSTVTGGETFYYSPFDGLRDGTRFVEDVGYLVDRNFGYEALMKIRCSAGLHIEQTIGNFFMRNSNEIELATIDCEKCFVSFVSFDGKLDEKVDCYFQCALLYTSLRGRRFIRIHNLSLPVTSALPNVFRSIELDCMMNMITKGAATQLPNTNLATIRDRVTDQATKTLAAYRKHCATSISSGQLILPETLKLFPLYILSLLKITALRTDPAILADEKVYHMRRLKSMSVKDSILLLYPRLMKVDYLPEDVGEYNERCDLILPQRIRLSVERISSDGAFLLDNGQLLILWIGRNISPYFLVHAFGVDTPEALDLRKPKLPSLQNRTSEQLNSLIEALRFEHQRHLPLFITRENDVAEIQFLQNLCEDRNHHFMSYVDYLCHVHRLIQASS